LVVRRVEAIILETRSAFPWYVRNEPLFMLIVEPFSDDIAAVVIITVLPVIVENPTPPTVMLETSAVDVASVLPDMVDATIAPNDTVEPVKEDRRTVLPVMVENASEPLYRVEADRVDVINVLPCAVENSKNDVIVFNIVARFMVRVLPVKRTTVPLTPFIVEPVNVDVTEITFAVTVLPPRVDTYTFRTSCIEPVMLDTDAALPRNVE
jgi:hypothetical protein